MLRQRGVASPSSSPERGGKSRNRHDAIKELSEGGALSAAAKLAGRLTRASGFVLFPYFFIQWISSSGSGSESGSGSSNASSGSSFAAHESLLLAPLFVSTLAANMAKAIVGGVGNMKELPARAHWLKKMYMSGMMAIAIPLTLRVFSFSDLVEREHESSGGAFSFSAEFVVMCGLVSAVKLTRAFLLPPTPTDRATLGPFRCFPENLLLGFAVYVSSLISACACVPIADELFWRVYVPEMGPMGSADASTWTRMLLSSVLYACAFDGTITDRFFEAVFAFFLHAVLHRYTVVGSMIAHGVANLALGVAVIALSRWDLWRAA